MVSPSTAAATAIALLQDANLATETAKVAAKAAAEVAEAEQAKPPDDGPVDCDDCQMWVNSPTQWEDHKSGKKHLKNEELDKLAKQLAEKSHRIETAGAYQYQ